jgi:KipI family sensor histidine kinase inhibitor
VLEYGRDIDPRVHEAVLAADRALAAVGLPGVEELVPTYRSLLVRIDPTVTTPEEVLDAMAAVEPDRRTSASHQLEVPVDFGRGEDLAAVAERTGVGGPDDVVALLTAAELRVYLHGFAPGFAYLGGVPPALDLPRRSTPRPPVPAGSVLLAAGQAALCPTPMPTGWWVVGHTDQQLFDPDADPPVPMLPGDRVRLVAVT